MVEDGESEVFAALDEGDAARAAQRALDVYGAEVFGFLTRVLDPVSAAREAYAQFGARVGDGIASCDRRIGLRVWSYAIARTALMAQREKAGSFSGRPPPAHLPEPTTTQPRRPTTALRGALSRLRDALSPDDRDLIVLRVDRALSFGDLAVVFLGVGATSFERAHEELRLRARFAEVCRNVAREAALRGILRGPS